MTRMMRVAKYRNQGGFTLLEVMVSMILTAILMIPVAAWVTQVYKRSGDQAQKRDTLTSIGLNRTFSRDVAASYKGTTSLPSNLDCTPNIAGGAVRLSLETRGSARRITYVEAPVLNEDGVTPRTDFETGNPVTRLLRRECQPAGAVITEKEVSTYLVPDTIGTTYPAVKVDCSARPRFNDTNDSCGVVVMRLNGDEGSSTVRASRRIDPDPDPQVNRKPTPVIRCNPSCPARGNRTFTVAFDGSLSTDPDPGGIAGYNWDFGDGSAATGEFVTHTYTTLGTYTVTLKVYNQSGNSRSETATVTVVNAAPVVIATPNPVDTFRGVGVDFDGSRSIDPDVNQSSGPPTYLWNFGDGTSSTLADPPPKQYFTLGSYTATFAVTDADGATRSVVIPVTVKNRPPVVAIVTNPPSVPCVDSTLAGTRCIATSEFPFTVTFDGSSSQDFDGSIGSGGYRWEVRRYGSGITGASGGPTLTRNFTTSGRYVVTLTVTDNDGGKTSSAVEVVINDPPIAVITPLSGLVLNGPPNTLSFDGSGSSDPDGTIVSYLWNFGDGSTSTAITPTHTWSNPAFGTIPVSLTVTDNNSKSVTKTVTVKVNRPPVPVMLPAPVEAFRKRPINFVGSNSTDPDGSVVSYLWNFGDGTTSTLANPSHTYQSKGTRTITLTVTDDDGKSATTTQTFTVQNQPPFAYTYPDLFVVIQGPTPGVLNADATNSVDLDGAVVSYEWDYGDGTSGTGFSANHTYPSYGTYNVVLTVTDDEGAQHTRPLTVKVNRRPNVGFTPSASQLRTNLPAPIDFDASASTDLDGTIANYTWNFGDGTAPITTTQSSIQYVYATRGTFTVSLTVTDNDGGTTTVTRPALVRVNRLPVPVLGTTPNGTGTPKKVVLNTNPGTVSFTAAGSTDPDGSIVSYAWNFGDGTTASGLTATRTYSGFGTYTATLTVTDNDGSTSSATIPVKVNRPPTAAISPAVLKTGRNLPFQFGTTGSSDTDGTLVSYFWTFGDGTTSTSSTPTKTYTTIGLFTVTLTVTDNDGLTGTVSRTFDTTNALPIPRVVTSPARAYRVGPPLTVTFDASTSSDPDGTIVSYSWDFAGQGTATGVTSSFTFTTYGTHNVILTVTDDLGGSASRTVPVRINMPPVPTFVTIPNPARSLTVPFTVGFDATGSYDPDGFLFRGRWEFGDGTNPLGLNLTPTHTYTAPGLYNVRIFLVDNDLEERSYTLVGAVRINRNPVAIISSPASPNVINMDPPRTVTFATVGTNDPDGSIASYSWDFGDGTTGTGPSPTKTYAAFGTYTAVLTVTDNDGVTSTASVVVKVNQAPTGAIGPATLDPKSGLPFTFQGGGSSDADGTIATYAWNFGDGTTGTGVSPTKTYAANGPYTVTLTVTDNNGRTSTTTRNLTVTTNAAPIAVISTTPSPARASVLPAPIGFSGTGSSDPDGAVASYSWNFGDGNTGTGATITHNYTAFGSYTAMLTVADNNGITHSTTVPVRIGRPPAISIETVPSPATLNIAPYFISLDASNTVDADGTIVSFAWNFGDGSTASGSIVDHTYATFGSYNAVLTVTDNEGFVSTKTVVVKVNRPPIADFQTIPSPPKRLLEATFDASLSTDPDGAPDGSTLISYEWDFGDGGDAIGKVVEHTYATKGEFIVTLRVVDSDGGVHVLTRPIEVVNQSPVSVITPDPLGGAVDNGQPIILSGADSFDPDGTITQYQWNFGDGSPNAMGVSQTHTFPGFGTYTVTLNVLDNDGALSTTTMQIKVNRRPIPVIGPPVITIYRNVPFTFSGAESSDPDGTISSYGWDFGDGTVGSGVSPAKTYSVLGTFVVTLSVADNNGASATTTRTITVLNQAPTARATATPNNRPILTPITFSGTTSTDPDGTIVSYSWSFGDGTPNGTGATVSHLYSSMGTKTATLTVTDNNGATNSTTVSVTVSTNQLPTANFTISPNSVNSPVNITMDASASSDPDGTISTYTWDFGDGTTGTGVNPSHLYTYGGWFPVKLTVTDNSGGTAVLEQTADIVGTPPAPSGLTLTDSGTFFSDWSWNPVYGSNQYELWIHYTSGACGDDTYITTGTTQTAGGSCLFGTSTAKVRSRAGNTWGPWSAGVNF